MSSHRKRRTLVAPEMNLSLDHSEGSLLSDDFLDTPDDLDINVDDIDTPDESDSLEFITNGNELEWEGKNKDLSVSLYGCSSFRPLNTHICSTPVELPLTCLNLRLKLSAKTCFEGDKKTGSDFRNSLSYTFCKKGATEIFFFNISLN